MTFSWSHSIAAAAAISVGVTALTIPASHSQAPPGKRPEQQQQVRRPAPQPVIRNVAPRPAPQASRPTARPEARRVDRPSAAQRVERPTPKIVERQPVQRPTPSTGGGFTKKVENAPTSVPKVTPATPKLPQPKVETKTNPPSGPKLPDKKVTMPIPPPTPGQTPGKLTAPTPGSIQVPGKLTAPGPGGPGQNKLPPGAQPTLPPKLPGTAQPTIQLPNKLPPNIAPSKLVPGTQPFPLATNLTRPAGPLKGLPPAGNWTKLPPKPAPGLNLTQLRPLTPGLKYMPRPTLPAPPPKMWSGPKFGYIPPALAWHPWRGRNVFPYFFVGAVIGASAYVGYNTWYAPVPSCYAGGSAVYYYPGTRTCFDFATAAPDDPFECHGRVFRWQPTRYRTVETLIYETRETSEPAEGWVEKVPERKAVVQASIKRSEQRAQTLQTVPLEQLDCSTCLSALGPIAGENGEATVSLVNNCEHDVAVSGGLAKQTAQEGDAPVCEFVGDVPKGAEVAACTRPTAEFEEAQIFLNAVTPVAGTAKPAPACRIPDQRAEAPQ